MEKASLLTKKWFYKDHLFQIPALFICALFLSPLLIFIVQVQKFALPNNLEFLSVIGWTFFQAGVSVLVIMFLSLFGAKGLLYFSNKRYYFLLEAFSILPSLLPPLILVTSIINLVQLVMPFPFGLTALIFCQIATYTGLCSVIFARVFLKEASLLSEWAYAHNLKPYKFLIVIARSILRKDLITMTALVFVATFTSLSLPLLVAGGKAVSLEFFIYEKLKIPSQWPLATTLILIQTIFVFIIYYKSFSSFTSFSLEIESRKIHLLKNKFLIMIPLFFTSLSLAGLFIVSNVTHQLQKLLEIKDLLIESLVNSFFIGIGVGSIVLLFLILISLSFQSVFLRRLLASYSIPGVTLLGFAFLLLPVYGRFFILIKWIVGLSFLVFSLVYRLRGEIVLDKLSGQVEVARLLGAGWLFIFRKILWPQTRHTFFFCAGIAGFLACGDFAYTLIVSQNHWNLALFTYDLLSSYRLDMAILMSWLLIIFSFLILIFWMSLDFIFNKKLKW